MPDIAPVLIAIDVESNERSSNQITEIGISTVDTRELAGIAPDAHGSAWRDKIRSRHFRIKEYAHVQNTEFVRGNPSDFRFGTSEFVSLGDAPAAIATCFRAPFSGPVHPQDSTTDDQTDGGLRKIVLVGHDFSNDIRYMRNLGYDVKNLSNLSKHSPILDTQGLYRMMTKAKDSPGLNSILYDLDIVGWSLHNAGNDARYTMEALLGIVVKRASEREVNTGAGEGA